MISGKEKIISILAISVLLLGIFSALYVNATQLNKDTVSINGNEYTLNQIFSMCTKRTIETDDGEKQELHLMI
jgi:glycine betaine/choline ABC-type transport system substrate-binding protein